MSRKNARPRCLALLLALILAAGLLAGCQPQPPDVPDVPPAEDPATEDVPSPGDIDAEVKALALSSLTEGVYPLASQGAYFAEDQPETPGKGDVRIDRLTYIGERVVYETVGVAYEMAYSHYFSEWVAQASRYLVLERSDYDDTWQGVFGLTDFVDPEKSVEEVIFEEAWSLMDLQVSLRLDGYPQLVGPGSPPNFFNEEAATEIMEGWEPIYGEGDYWVFYNYTRLSALCYHNELEGRESVNSIETTRSDLATYQGIRIGDTRESALAACPGLRDDPCWSYEGDYLWYCSNDEGWGAILILWFENDAVAKIELLNMFD